MHKLEIKLKQHTPLIHFQHDQEGATLRASEVKPKLDKYILSRLTPEARQNGEKEGWIKKKNDKEWLDYKMEILSSKPRDISMNDDIPEMDRNGQQKHDSIGRLLYKTPNYPDNKNSLIMGNIGGHIKEEVLNFVLFDNISLFLFIKSEALYQEVYDNIFNFFFETTFGNRTSKGFGSFTVYSINGEVCIIKPIIDWQISFDIESEDCQMSEKKAMKDIFIVINRVWKGLKKYTRAPNGDKSVFLNVKSKLTNPEDRIPSPVLFKPRIKSRKNNKWEVVIYVFLKHDVISAAGADANDFFDLLDRAVKEKTIQKSIRNYTDYSYSISNITVQ